jgi:hypothetical protein
MKRASVFFPWFLVLLFVVAPATAGASSLVAISTQTLPNGTGGTPYSAIITASGGCKPYYWSTTGNLPPGVSPTASNTSATFAGTPSAAGSYTFTVAVKGCGGHIARATYTVVIQPAANHIVNLSWDVATSPDTAGYNLYRSAAVTGPYIRVNVSLIPSVQYTDTTVSNNSVYFYRATAVNTENMESQPSGPPLQVIVPQ